MNYILLIVESSKSLHFIDFNHLCYQLISSGKYEDIKAHNEERKLRRKNTLKYTLKQKKSAKKRRKKRKKKSRVLLLFLPEILFQPILGFKHQKSMKIIKNG